MFLARRLSGFGALVLAAAALYFTGLAAWSDWVSRDATRAGILAAIRMTPENWTLYRMWGEFVPADGVAALNGAVARNPVNPQLRLESAEVLEAAGRNGEAETRLLEAVSLDRTATARVLAAEFYFRRGDEAHFLGSARGALAVAEKGDAEIFREYWAISNGQVGDVVPNRPEILPDYLDFLIDSRRFDAAERVGTELMRVRRDKKGRAARVLMKYCTAMAREGRAEQAVAAWNWLARERAIPYAALGERAQEWVTDGDFQRELGDGAGFEWRRTDAVFSEWVEKSRELRVTFSGKQPERCEVLSQEVALWPGREYWLRVKYEMRGIGAESGLRWKVALRDGRVLGEAAMPGGVDSVEMRFGGDLQGAAMARLVLEYERALGTVRIEGEVAIRNVASGWR